MNWYKRSQQEPGNYFDVGHGPVSKSKSIVWMSDLSGGDFKMQETGEGYGMTHGQAFGYNRQNKIWGRYDEANDMVSIALPKHPRIQNQSIDPQDLPNRLMDRLVSEFPEARIYGFPFDGGPIRIV